MRRTPRPLYGLANLLLLLLLALGSPPAEAAVEVASITAGCSELSATGTSTAPYVTLFAWNTPDPSDYWFIVIPAVGGSFGGTLVYPPAAPGETYNYQVWGSLNPYEELGDPGYWDGEEFYSVDLTACSVQEIPTASSVGLLFLGISLAIAAWATLWSRRAFRL